MESRSERVARCRRNLKAKAVEYLGGKCLMCGYARCIDALEFHHRDPEAKDFAISSKGIYRSFDRVKVELDKCDLLCANCHREVHAEWKAQGINKRKIVQNIPWPSKESLQAMLWEKPATQIAESLGVSRNTVRNWIRKLKVSPPPHGYWLGKTRKQHIPE